MDVNVKFGDYRSSCSRDIRLPHFVKEDEQRMTTNDTGVCQSSHKGKNACFTAFLPKNYSTEIPPTFCAIAKEQSTMM